MNKDFEDIKKQVDNLEEMFGDLDTEFDYDSFMSNYGFNMKELETEMGNYSPKRDLGYMVVNFDAVEPKYNYETDSGFDLHSVEEIIIPAFGRSLVPTGLIFDIPDGFELQVRPKSGLAINHGLTVLNTPGTVDCGYTGEVKVIVFNTNTTEFVIKKGMKIAQGVLCPVVNGKWVQLNKLDNIIEKDRNSSGFGSTGI